MHKILFICHGNICRSPMAEFLLKDIVKKRGIAADFEIASAATSREEIGNPVHYGTRNKLAQYGISVAGKHAVQVTKRDYEYYDLLLVMDSNNIRNLRRVIGEDTQVQKQVRNSQTVPEISLPDKMHTADYSYPLFPHIGRVG